MVSYEVSEDTKEQTVRCASGFKCLTSECTMCSIKKCLEKTLIVKVPKNFLCSYHVSYGDVFFCLCPMRHEIYKSYGI